MNVLKVMPLLKKYEKCPICGSSTIGNGQGGIIIENNNYTRTCKCGFFIKVNENGKVLVSVNMLMKKFDECLKTWNDLPSYVYTEEYKEAFKKFIKNKVEIGQTVDESIVVMTLHHETGNKLPYFKFRR